MPLKNSDSVARLTPICCLISRISLSLSLFSIKSFASVKDYDISLNRLPIISAKSITVPVSSDSTSGS